MRKKSIFVAVGSHSQQFDRLVKEADRIAGKLGKKAEFFAQTGFGIFEPKNMKFKKFLSLQEFDSAMEKAEIIICHGGAGSIGQAMQLGKKVIIVPRLEKFKEHTNDHQLELAEIIGKEQRIKTIVNIKGLENAVLSEMQKEKKAKARKSTKIVELVKCFVEKNFQAK